MQRKLVFALALLTPIVGLARPARADNCSSATRVLSSVWKHYGELALSSGCAVAAVASSGAIDFKLCFGRAGELNQLAQGGVRYINKMSAGSWRSLGPRPLIFGEEASGTVVSTFGRMFISSGPSAGDDVTLTLLKRAGKARASVTVCKVDQQGKATQLGGDLVFEPGKDNVDEKVTLAFMGVRGHILSVHIDSKSALNKFAYSLTATVK